MIKIDLRQLLTCYHFGKKNILNKTGKFWSTAVLLSHNKLSNTESHSSL